MRHAGASDIREHGDCAWRTVGSVGVILAGHGLFTLHADGDAVDVAHDQARGAVGQSTGRGAALWARRIVAHASATAATHGARVASTGVR